MGEAWKQAVRSPGCFQGEDLGFGNPRSLEAVEAVAGGALGAGVLALGDRTQFFLHIIPPPPIGKIGSGDDGSVKFGIKGEGSFNYHISEI